jgi:hypothetical protein
MTGDQTDIFNRLKGLLPNGWFQEPTPVLDALLTGIASALSYAYGLIAYSYLQTRIRTATDYFLDLISLDFFGTAWQRRANESDTSFRNRILALLLLAKGTRPGMSNMLTVVTGNKPRIFEPIRVADTGCYGSPTFHAPFIGYNQAGGWTIPSLFPYQALVVVYPGNGATNQDIYNAVEETKPLATRIWVAIGGHELTDDNGNVLTDDGGNVLFGN